MEKILEYKSSIEKEKVEDYTKINILLSKEKDHLDSLESEYNSNAQKKSMNVNEMKLQLLYREKLSSQLNSQKKKVVEIETKLENARGDLIEASKDRKILEKLKEKDKEKYDAELASREQKELDDLSIMKYGK
jgi:flagellar FliJ protein